MATSTHRARVVWEGGEDVRAHRIELGKQTLAGSSAAELGGDATKANPETLMAGALSTCHMLWFLDLARKEGLAVASYEDEADATLDGDRISGAVLRPRVGWEGEAPSTEALDALHHRSHELCFISNSVDFPVEVKAR